MVNQLFSRDMIFYTVTQETLVLHHVRKNCNALAGLRDKPERNYSETFTDFVNYKIILKVLYKLPRRLPWQHALLKS